MDYKQRKLFRLVYKKQKLSNMLSDHLELLSMFPDHLKLFRIVFVRSWRKTFAFQVGGFTAVAPLHTALHSSLEITVLPHKSRVAVRLLTICHSKYCKLLFVKILFALQKTLARLKLEIGTGLMVDVPLSPEHDERLVRAGKLLGTV